MKNKLAVVAITVAMLIWGTTFIIAKEIGNNVTPGYLVFLRSLIASCFLFVFCFRRFKKPSKKFVAYNMLTGAIIGTAYIIQLIGMKYTSSAKTAFLENVYVAIVPFLSIIVTRKKPRVVTIFTSLACFLGVCLIAFGDGLMDGNINIGDILAIVAGVLYGVNIVLSGHLYKDKDPITYTFGQFATVTLVALIYFLIAERKIPEMTTGNVMALIYLAVCGSGIAWILRNYAQNHLQPTTISIILPFTSVVSMIIGAAIGESKITLTFIIGAIIILLSIFADTIFNNIKTKKRFVISKGERK